MMLRLLSVGACAMTAMAFATMKKDKRIGGSVVVESENAGGGYTGSCPCRVNVGQQSFFSPSMYTPDRWWSLSYAYTAFTLDYDECFAETAPNYGQCSGPEEVDLFKAYACGDYSDGPTNGIAVSRYGDGKNYFQALTERLPDQTNALLASYNGVDNPNQVSSYTFCNGFGASGGFPPAPPGKIYNNFACNKLIDNKMYEAANSVSLVVPYRYDDPDACYKTLAALDPSLSGTLCELLYKDTGVWIETFQGSGEYNMGAMFCQMRATDSGTMGCQWHAEPYIIAEGDGTEGQRCPTTRAPSAPPATGRRS